MSCFILNPRVAGTVDLAVQSLCSDVPVAFPTETVYGLGANAYSDRAVANIFVYKNRPRFNPVSVCYKSVESASNDLIFTNEAVEISRLLPGPVTIVLEKKDESRLSQLCSPNTKTIGLRIPKNEIALKLLDAVPFPLAAPSANKSGNLSPVSAESVAEDFCDADNLIILDGGKCSIGIETTIIDCSRETPCLIRSGAISAEEISGRCGVNIIANPDETHANNKYHGTKPVIINFTSACFPDDAILAFGKPIENDCKYVLNLSPSGDLGEAAANFFPMLDTLMKSPAARICVMPIPNIGIGIAINDRLQKAAAS